MMLLAAFGFLCSMLTFFFAYQGVHFLLNIHFYGSAFLYNAEKKNVDKFQKYVTYNKIEATDSEEIRNWAEKHRVRQMTISRKRVLLYDNLYRGAVPISGAESQQLHVTMQYFHRVHFADGWADVFMYNGEDVKIYFAFDLLVALLAAIVWILIFWFGTRKEVNYIKLLRKELRSDQEKFTVLGEDEVTELAIGLTQMTSELKKKEENEKAMRQVQENLVLSMAHDLRNPLTGAATYLEILRRMDIDPEAKRYVNLVLGKTEEIKSLSDQLFEFFLVHNSTPVELEKPALIKSTVGEYLSELCALLEGSGFIPLTDKIRWPNKMTEIYSEYLGRISNNLYTNILKYAEPDSEIIFSSKTDEQIFLLTIRNVVGEKANETESHGFGLKNIQAMMKKMNGTFFYQMNHHTFTVQLGFQIAEAR